jgi:hypothetical protein
MKWGISMGPGGGESIGGIPAVDGCCEDKMRSENKMSIIDHYKDCLFSFPFPFLYLQSL